MAVDRMLSNPNLWGLIIAENHRQIKKWGIQDHTWFQWLGYLIEEVGELSAAISEVTHRDGLQSNIVEEAVQAATLAIKIAEMAIASRS